VEGEDLSFRVDLDDAEVGSLLLRDRDDGDRGLAALEPVEGEHLADFHLVDVVAAEDADVLLACRRE
jgi:hypothetical protein